MAMAPSLRSEKEKAILPPSLPPFPSLTLRPSELLIPLALLCAIVGRGRVPFKSMTGWQANISFAYHLTLHTQERYNKNHESSGKPLTYDIRKMLDLCTTLHLSLSYSRNFSVLSFPTPHHFNCRSHMCMDSISPSTILIQKYVLTLTPCYTRSSLSSP